MSSSAENDEGIIEPLDGSIGGVNIEGVGVGG